MSTDVMMIFPKVEYKGVAALAGAGAGNLSGKKVRSNWLTRTMDRRGGVRDQPYNAEIQAFSREISDRGYLAKKRVRMDLKTFLSTGEIDLYVVRDIRVYVRESCEGGLPFAFCMTLHHIKQKAIDNSGNEVDGGWVVIDQLNHKYSFTNWSRAHNYIIRNL